LSTFFYSGAKNVTLNSIFSAYYLRIVYIGSIHQCNHRQQRQLTVLALATLGDATKNRNNPIICRVTQELSLVTVAGIIALGFANVNTA
jgi:hypothetical protein